jgi:hypothetical protein
MDKVRLVLTVISIAIIAVPLVGILLVNQGNLLGLIVPPEANDIIDQLSSAGGSDAPMIEPVGEPQYNETAHTVTMTFDFTNPVPFDVTLNSMSGNVECVAHHFPLGNLTLEKPVSVAKGETKPITIIGNWTDAAIAHFRDAHAGEAMVDANIVDLTVDVKGIQVGMGTQNIEIPNPTYTG